MPTVTFIEFNGTEHHVKMEAGQSAMQAAVTASIPGVLADCGGNCSCATCHGYVDPAWVERLPEAKAEEKEMLDCAINVQDNSRLTCQIHLTRELDGLVIRLPKSQI